MTDQYHSDLFVLWQDDHTRGQQTTFEEIEETIQAFFYDQAFPTPPCNSIELPQTELVQMSDYEIAANLTMPEPQEIAMPINVHVGVLDNMVAITIQTCLCTARANTSKSITAADTRRAAALSALTSTRCSPASVLQFRGFPAQESTTPTHCAPSAFVEEIDDDQEDYIPSDNGPGDDGPNGNDPDGDNPSGDDPEPHDDEEEPISGLPSQDDAGMIIFNNLSITIDRLARSA
ncbi:hypothetical protein SCLCIDRAFT_23580 [Scleroderma citrinum Foug A]|uniref:Uncharacterized protein n=1 Tax=Scleroderma citrinum Foug A TaxID=1036808 RepID=A0A0C3E723_9AGAM|nr:hypothetical protein SCLCIDRAFT_23580 [Scleroderma citrinum Foug A]